MSTDYEFYVDGLLAERVSNVGSAAQIRQYDNIALGSGLSNGFTEAYFDNMRLEFIEPVILGDFNDDFLVSQTDYLILVANLHTDVSQLLPAQSYPFGNITGDREIDGRDFLGFVKAYDDFNGVGAFQAMLDAVPEPGSVGLAAIGVAAAPALRRRRTLAGIQFSRIRQGKALLTSIVLVAMMTPGAQASIISTFDSGGADVEVREALPMTARGLGNELGLRVSAAQNGHIYIKLGVQTVTPLNLNYPIKVRTTWRNNNVANNRIEDAIDVVNATFEDRPNVLFDYYVLDPNHAGASWDESTMVYGPGVDAAPALAFDGDFNTKDLVVGPGNLTFLGSNELRSLARDGNGPGSMPIENRIPIGEALDLTLAPGSPLHNAIVAAQSTAHQTITIVMTLQHDPSSPNAGWLNFNYLFNPKELSTLNVDAGYDSDTTNPGNPLGAPLGGSANTAGTPFAPQLVLVDQPIPADFDDDGDVDVTDYLTLVANLHTDVSSLTPAQSYSLGDMTRDLELNGRDFLAFVKAYDDANGVAAFAAMLAAIPEPTAGGLAAWAILAISSRRAVRAA
jgi:hypothetical protein